MNGSMLIPIARHGKTADGHITWKYRCACGNTVITAASRVKHGYTRSCGCLHGGKVIHGYKNTPTYSSWSSAKDRATNPKSKDFYRYGAIGIGMAERWLNFENFLADMGPRPSDKSSIDRIDPTKGYESGNCRWATPQEQARNRVNFVVVSTPVGIMPLVDYAKHIGITNGCAHLRLKRNQMEGVSRV